MERIEQLEKTVAGISEEIKNIKEVITTGFKKVDENFESIRKEIKHIHVQFDHLNKKVDLLKGDTSEGFDDVGLKLDNLTDEITKIGHVTNYEEYYKNLKSIQN